MSAGDGRVGGLLEGRCEAGARLQLDDSGVLIGGFAVGERAARVDERSGDRHGENNKFMRYSPRGFC